jgi:hypothetical protein
MDAVLPSPKLHTNDQPVNNLKTPIDLPPSLMKRSDLKE